MVELYNNKTYWEYEDLFLQGDYKCIRLMVRFKDHREKNINYINQAIEAVVFTQNYYDFFKAIIEAIEILAIEKNSFNSVNNKLVETLTTLANRKIGNGKETGIKARCLYNILIITNPDISILNEIINIFRLRIEKVWEWWKKGNKDYNLRQELSMISIIGKRHGSISDEYSILSNFEDIIIPLLFSFKREYSEKIDTLRNELISENELSNRENIKYLKYQYYREHIIKLIERMINKTLEDIKEKQNKSD